MTSSPSPFLPSTGPSGGPKPPSEPQVPPLAKDEVRVTGMVEHVEVEGGCTVLRVDGGQTFELMGGDRQVIQPGAHLTVHGRVRTDIATVCQVGPVLEVITAQPA